MCDVVADAERHERQADACREDDFGFRFMGMVAIPVTIPAGTTHQRYALFDADVSPGSDVLGSPAWPARETWRAYSALRKLAGVRRAGAASGKNRPDEAG